MLIVETESNRTIGEMGCRKVESSTRSSYHPMHHDTTASVILACYRQTQAFATLRHVPCKSPRSRPGVLAGVDHERSYDSGEPSWRRGRLGILWSQISRRCEARIRASAGCCTLQIQERQLISPRINHNESRLPDIGPGSSTDRLQLLGYMQNLYDRMAW